MAEQINSPEINPAPFVFKDTPKVSFCTAMSCSDGHTWPAEIQVTACPGCKSPLLAIRMVNCPQCNEPSTALRLRADHLGRGQAITATCQGSASLADIHEIHVKLNHAAQEQATHQIRLLPDKI